MKKNLLTILILVLLFATTITGCGGKETADEDKRVESVEQKADDTKTDEQTSEDNTDSAVGQAVTGEGVMVEGPSDDGVIEMEGEVIEIGDGEVTEIIEGEVTESLDDEVVEVEGEVSTDIIPDDGIDWSVKYDDFFDRENIMTDKPRITIISAVEDVVAEMVVAAVDEDVYISYDFGTAAIDMYVSEDKVYAMTKMEGEAVWYWAPVVLEEDVDFMLRTADTTPVDREDMAGWTYQEAIEEDGVIYDVLDVAVADDNGSAGTAVYFVNRDTQLIEKYVMKDQESTAMAVCLVEEIESIELPAEAEQAMEVTMEDILEAMVNVFSIGMNIGTE